MVPATDLPHLRAGPLAIGADGNIQQSASTFPACKYLPFGKRTSLAALFRTSSVQLVKREPAPQQRERGPCDVALGPGRGTVVSSVSL